MKTSVDAAGRRAMPKPEPGHTGMTLLRRGQGLVSVPEDDLPPLTDDMVRETLEQMRRQTESTSAVSARRSPG